jgi:hypothetical protein
MARLRMLKNALIERKLFDNHKPIVGYMVDLAVKGSPWLRLEEQRVFEGFCRLRDSMGKQMRPEHVNRVVPATVFVPKQVREEAISVLSDKNRCAIDLRNSRASITRTTPFRAFKTEHIAKREQEAPSQRDN